MIQGVNQNWFSELDCVPSSSFVRLKLNRKQFSFYSIQIKKSVELFKF